MTKKRTKAKIGRPIKHGGFSIINRDRAVQDNPEIRRYLEACREGLVRDVAGSEDKLSAQQTIMIDRIISRLAVCRLIEVYVERLGIFRRDRLEGGKVLELEPALGVNYLAFSNSIDRALAALGLGKREEGALDLGRYIAEADAKEAKVKTESQGDGHAHGKGKGKAAVQGQAGRVADQGDGQGKDQRAGAIDDPRPTSSDVSEPDDGDNGDEPDGSSKGI